MSITNEQQLLHHRLIVHHLAGNPLSSPREVVQQMAAIQAQDFGMAIKAVALRCAGSEEQAIAAFNRGEFLRTHVLRPTWHFVAPENIRWMLALSCDSIRRASDGFARQYNVIVSEEEFERAFRLLENLLAGGKQLTRQAIQEEIKRNNLPHENQHIQRYLYRAEIYGLICSGALQGKKQTYALLDERVPSSPSMPRDEAVARLLQLYLHSHAPATLADFSWWSGLTLTESKQGLAAIRSRTEEIELGNNVYYLLTDALPPSPPAIPSELLLPAFDEYAVAYRDRTAFLPPEHNRRLISAQGIFRPAIVADGKVIGQWKNGTNEYEKEYW
jgi:hypothetical protein